MTSLSGAALLVAEMIALLLVVTLAVTLLQRRLGDADDPAVDGRTSPAGRAQRHSCGIHHAVLHVLGHTGSRRHATGRCAGLRDTPRSSSPHPWSIR